MRRKNVVKFKYTGRGFLPGIPARDLYQDDVEKIGDLALAIVIGAGLYSRVEEDPDQKVKHGKRN